MYQEDISKTPEITETEANKFVNVHSLLKNDKLDSLEPPQLTDRENNQSMDDSNNIITNQRYGPRPGDSIDMDIDLNRKYMALSN